MRKSILLFLLLISVPFLHCTDYPSGVRDLGRHMVPLGHAFSIEGFPMRNSTAYAIVSNDEVYAILVPNPPFVVPNALTDKNGLEAALYARALSLGFDPNATSQFSAVHAGIGEIADDKDLGIAECRRLLGTDRFPCESFETCRLACFATPFCPNFAYGGDPGEFIYVIWAYENNSRNLELAYSGEQEAYALFADSPTQENAGKYLISLSSLNRAATSVASSALYGYSFCFLPDYALPEMAELQLLAQTHYRNASHFYGLPLLAQQVQNRTLEGLARKARASLPTLPALPSMDSSQPAQNSTANATVPPNFTGLGKPNPPSNSSSGPGKAARFELSAGILAPVALLLVVLCAVVAGAYFVLKRKEGGSASKKA